MERVDGIQTLDHVQWEWGCAGVMEIGGVVTCSSAVVSSKAGATVWSVARVEAVNSSSLRFLATKEVDGNATVHFLCDKCSDHPTNCTWCLILKR